jgi:hypothetical protein
MIPIFIQNRKKIIKLNIKFKIYRIQRKKIYNNILETIGNSPMVRINKITEAEGIKCEIGNKENNRKNIII